MDTLKLHIRILKSLLANFHLLPIFKGQAASGSNPPKAGTEISVPRQPRMYVDSAAFDPHQMHNDGRAVIVMTQYNADTIGECVHQLLSRSSGVVVIDYGSADATPYLAAAAGAVVLLPEPEIF